MRSALNIAFVVAVWIQLVLPSNSTKLIWFKTKLHKKRILQVAGRPILEI